MEDLNLAQRAERVLGKWGEQRRESESVRDGMVRGAIWAGVAKHRVYVLTGIARTTIDRIAETVEVPTDEDRRLILTLIDQLGGREDR